jgi:transaldolase
VGGDVVITMPSSWQKKFNASAIEVRDRMHEPVDPLYINELLVAFADFRRAFQPDGMTVDEFDSFPPSVRTLRAFIASYHDLLAAVTDAQLPNPDVRS